MIRILMPIALFASYFDVKPLLAVLGTLFLIGFCVGFLVYALRPQKINRTQIPLRNGLLKRHFIIPKPRESSGLSLSVKNLISKFIIQQLEQRTPFMTIFKRVHQTSLMDEPIEENLKESFLDYKMSQISAHLVFWITKIRSEQLHESFLQTTFTILKQHMQLYKKYRKDLESQDLTKRRQTGHLDEFNEFQTDQSDESSQWFFHLDKINEEIVNRMTLNGILHPAARSEQAQVNYLRQFVIHVLEPLDIRSKIIKTLTRECILNIIALPLISNLSDPDYLNFKLLQEANHRIVMQRSIKGFRALLDQAFHQFPPFFLLRGKSGNLSFVQRMNLIEVTIKHSRRMNSVVDLTALLHETNQELKKVRERLSEIQLLDAERDARKYAEMRKLNHSYELLKTKIRKRLTQVMSDEVTNEKQEKPVLDLQTLLENYYHTMLDQSKSSSVIYFLEFLEKKKDPISMQKLKFWLHAESYRRLVWRISTGIISTDDLAFEPETNEKIDFLPLEAHDRLRRQVQEIYLKHVAPISDQFPNYLLDSFERYIAPLLSDMEESKDDDYLCVVKAQAHILSDLQSYFAEFQHSDSFFKFTSDQEKQRITQRQDTSDTSYKQVYYDESNLMKSLSRELDQYALRMTGIQQQQDQHFQREQTIELELESSAEEDLIQEKEFVQFIAPGELLATTSKLSQIKDDIDSCMARIDCVDLLIWKSKQNRQSETFPMLLYILEQTRESLKQDIGELSRQKARFESHEQREAIVPGMCTITIEPEEKNEITFYLVHIVKTDKSGWSLRRRYSDFDALHRKLRKLFPIVNDFDLPSKTIGLWPKAKMEARQARTKMLERYLQRLVDTPDICQSEQLKNFLSSDFRTTRRQRLFQFQDEVKKTQRKLAETISNLKPKPFKMREFLHEKRRSWRQKKMGSDDEKQKESSSEDQIWSDSSDLDKNSDYSDEKVSDIDKLSDVEKMSDSERLSDNESHGVEIAPVGSVTLSLLTSFLDLLLECFDFKEQSQYLRYNAATELVSSVTGFKDDLEQDCKILLKFMMRDETIIEFLEHLEGPSIHLLEHFVANDPKYTKMELKSKLVTFASMVSSVLGQETATTGINRLFEMMQHRTLNRHVLFTILDALKLI
ncbi:hypothetical protein EDD86DRAFT_209350 [Gorgonomyces haynaldii]|nr:hypothetical protein EDD86DRAFT_209350 [Gorgonomyces haynaldii]